MAPSSDALSVAAVPLDRLSAHPSGVNRGRVAALWALAALLPAAGIVSLTFGSVQLSAASILGALTHPAAQGVQHSIVWELRLPRLLTGIAVGSGLGVAGAMLQALFRNPLVDPYITGVSAGAALAATLGLALGVSFEVVPLAAFAGGLACAAIVALIGAGDGPAGNLRLVLAGVALSALCSAFVTLLLLRSGTLGGLSILSWLAGGISARSWPEVRWISGYMAAGFLLSITLMSKLNLLRLGTDAAAGLGLKAGIARWQVLALSAFITAACVAVSGVVGFVGLMVPHGARRLVGGDARWLLPACACGGATVVVLADTLARTVLPSAEVPLGVLLAIVGVPFFLAIARRPVEL